jgi:hypothetical protein
MFREHVQHLQHELLSTFAMLPKHTKAYIQKSWAGHFYKRIFSKINENKFSVLFSNKKSRPNSPINIYVALEIMKNLFNWSDEEMISNFHCNLQVCYAVGIENLGEITIAPRTIYYNRARIIDYEERTGVNLFEEVFQEITLKEINSLGLDTSIQRMDSSMISSNIKKMSRLEIAIKVLQNFYGDLPEEEQHRLYNRIKDYVKSEAENITFKLKHSDLDEQLKKVGELLLYIHTYYQNNKTYNILKSFAHVQRVLDEQFVLEDDNSTISLKPPHEISSSSLQNPADDEATYRSKKNKGYQGYALNISETCAKENNTQLITDVSLYTNNTSDEQILEERIEQIKERTGVEELVVDGGYSGETSENACEEQDVKLIFTGIKGAKQSEEKLGLYNFKLNENGIQSCPKGDKPISEEYKLETGRHVVHFDKEQCLQCPLRKQCCVQDRKKFTTLYFDDQQMRVARKRQQFTEEEYRAKQKLRPAVEGTISLFKRRAPNGKVRVRGLKRVRNVAILTALAINFRRIAVVIDDIFCFFYYFAIKTLKVELKIIYNDI